MNEILKAERLARGWTQLQASNEINVDYRTYRRWEMGETQPSLHNVGKLCALFEKSRAELGFGEAK